VTTKQGSLELLGDPVARELLDSTIPARLAYNWFDGTPRVVPIWFYWDGQEFVLGSSERAPKLKAIEKNPSVALTIDENSFPHKVLLVRGKAKVQMTEGLTPEYAACARRY
jgi:nitroimidazol reductase NimA-like FMN-containing flavoprotein (pyridoxamine 5'-phosphate oxidase superfamily)